MSKSAANGGAAPRFDISFDALAKNFNIEAKGVATEVRASPRRESAAISARRHGHGAGTCRMLTRVVPTLPLCRRRMV